MREILVPLVQQPHHRSVTDGAVDDEDVGPTASSDGQPLEFDVDVRQVDMDPVPRAIDDREGRARLAGDDGERGTDVELRADRDPVEPVLKLHLVDLEQHRIVASANADRRNLGGRDPDRRRGRDLAAGRKDRLRVCRG